MTIIITVMMFMIITMVRVHKHQLNNNRKGSSVLESCFITRANHNISRANALNGLQIQSELLQRRACAVTERGKAVLLVTLRRVAEATATRERHKRTQS